jgi:hypothetical protein
MRLFVFCASDEPLVDPYILAEVVRDSADDRGLSLAAALAGPRSSILTRVELSATLEGRRALGRWEERDDSMFETETLLLTRTGRVGTVRLHVVKENDREPVVRSDAKLPMDERLRQTILISRGLREVTRQVIQRARALRTELHESLADNNKVGEQVG